MTTALRALGFNKKKDNQQYHFFFPKAPDVCFPNYHSAFPCSLCTGVKLPRSEKSLLPGAHLTPHKASFSITQILLWRAQCSARDSSAYLVSLPQLTVYLSHKEGKRFDKESECSPIPSCFHPASIFVQCFGGETPHSMSQEIWVQKERYEGKMWVVTGLFPGSTGAGHTGDFLEEMPSL